MIESDFNDNDFSLREKIIKFLKLDVFFSGIQLQLKLNKKDINKFKDEINLYREEVNKLREEVIGYKEFIESMALVGADVHLNSPGWGVICYRRKNNAPYVKFFEISQGHDIREIESIIHNLQPNDKNVIIDSPIMYRNRMIF